MLEPSSLGEMTWKPPWSHGASVQQDPGVADKEEGDPGGGPGHQRAANTKAAFPAGRLTLPSPSQQRKQGGCNDVRLLWGLEGEFCTWIKMRPTDTRLSDHHVCEELRQAPTLPPHPLGGGSAYITSTDLSRDHLSTKSPGERRYQQYQVGWRRESGGRCTDQPARISSIRSSKPS